MLAGAREARGLWRLDSRRRLRLSAVQALAELERRKAEFGPELDDLKFRLLVATWSGELRGAAAITRFHEQLCFMQAYPDGPRVEAIVGISLAFFRLRYLPELLRHTRAFINSGIDGARIHFRFFAPTARWLAAETPATLTLDWDELENVERLEVLLPLLAHPAESPGLDEYDFTPREWIARMKSPGETDAAFLIRRFDQLPMDAAAREILWDGLDIPMWLDHGDHTLSKTWAGFPARPKQVATVRAPLPSARPDLRAEFTRRPRAMTRLSEPDGQRLVDLARAAMVTRERDLDAFAYGDPRDVRLVSYDDGLQFACIGVIPERRLLLESVYGYLTLKNGVPVGYVLTSALYGSSELAYNVFDTFRGVEAATIYARVLAMTHHVFGTDTFTIYPYQLGDGNDEAIDSGAWWFYYKLGFRPRPGAIARLAQQEVERIARNPAHRSSRPTLRRLATENLYFQPHGDRDDIIGELSLANVGLAVTAMLARRFGADRARALEVCAGEAGTALGSSAWRHWSMNERRAWERWAPVTLLLPGLARWSAAERRALVEIVRLKGARVESDFVRAFDAHRKLRRALARLAASADPDRR